MYMVWIYVNNVKDYMILYVNYMSVICLYIYTHIMICFFLRGDPLHSRNGMANGGGCFGVTSFAADDAAATWFERRSVEKNSGKRLEHGGEMRFHRQIQLRHRKHLAWTLHAFCLEKGMNFTKENCWTTNHKLVIPCQPEWKYLPMNLAAL